MACDASASSSSAGNPAFPRYMAAERTISKTIAVARPKVETEGAPSEALFSSEKLFSTCGNKRDSNAYQHHANPPSGAHLFAQNIFRAKRTYDVTERRGRNHEADCLPGQQDQQRVEGDGKQGHA